MVDENKILAYKFIEEVSKCIGSQVEIISSKGKINGLCVAIHPQHLNVVLMSNKEKIIIKNPQMIRRKRNLEWQKVKDKEKQK